MISLVLDGYDLSSYVRVPDDAGLDPQGDPVDPQYAGAAALSEGLAFAQDAVSNRDWVIPLNLSASTPDAVNALKATIEAHIFQGAVLSFTPEGASNTSYFDVEGGKIVPAYRHFVHRHNWLQAVLHLQTRPFAGTGTSRVIASFQGTGPQQFAATSIGGDVAALANLEVRAGSQVASSGRLIAYGVHSSASFSAIRTLASGATVEIVQAGATVRGASGAIGSQYLAMPVSPTTVLPNALLRDYLVPPGGYVGRHRLLMVARSGLAPANALTLYAKDRFGAVLGPTVIASQIDQTKWQVLDLGEVQVPARRSSQEPVPTQYVEIIGGGASGASVIASPALQACALVYVPIDQGAGVMRTPGAGAGQAYGDDFYGVTDDAALDGRAGLNGVWSRVYGTLYGLRAGGGLYYGGPAFAGVPGSGMYAFASGVALRDVHSTVNVTVPASALASGAAVELWSKGVPASGAATVGVRAKLVLGPSSAISVALLSHNGTATTLHASAGLGASAASAIFGGQQMKLVVDTAGGEGRVWLATNGAVGSPLLNPSHANLDLIAGGPMLAANEASYFLGELRLDDFYAAALGSAPDTNAREWFRFEAYPEPRSFQGNASVFKKDWQGYTRGQPPRIAPTGSPMASGPAQVVVLQGELDNYVGSDILDVNVAVRERWSFLR